MVPLLKGNSQASGAITFHILAIGKLTFSPSPLTFSLFSVSVIHSRFLMTGKDRYVLWFMLPKLHSASSHTFPSAAMLAFAQLLVQSQHHPDLLPPHPFQCPKWTVYTSFIPNPMLFEWAWCLWGDSWTRWSRRSLPTLMVLWFNDFIGPDRGINLTPIFRCHLEEGKALEVLEAVNGHCFQEMLDPLDLHEVIVHR